MKNKKVCVIIPTLDEEEYIGELIESIKRNTYPNKEIIVVDDGSTDKTVEIARERNATVLISRPGLRGPAYGRNIGGKHTNADILCFLDADWIIEDVKFLEKCVNVFDDNVVAVYAAFRTIQDTLMEKILFKGEGISSFPTFIDKNIFFKLGGYPEIGVGEDVIFTRRLKDYVKKNKMEEKVIDETFFSGHGVHSVGEMYKQAKWYGKTSILAIKELHGRDKILYFFSSYSRIFYFLSFLSLFLIPISNLFLLTSLPFFIGLTYILLKSYRNKYNAGKSITFLIFGVGMLHGLILFFLGIRAERGGR